MPSCSRSSLFKLALATLLVAPLGLAEASSASAAAPSVSRGPQVHGPRLLNVKLLPGGTVAVRVLVDCTFNEADNFTYLHVFVEQLHEPPRDISLVSREYLPFTCVGHPQVVIVKLTDGYERGPAQVEIEQGGSCEFTEDDDQELTIPFCDGEGGDPSFETVFRSVFLR